MTGADPALFADLPASGMRFAVTGGYSRVEWGTAEENLRARTFYAKLGTAPAARLSYRLENDALAEAAQGRWPAPEEET